MTSLYRCRASLSEVASAFGAEVPPGLGWQSTLWPGRDGLVILHENGRRRLERMRWEVAGRYPIDARRRRLVTPYIDNLMSPIGFGDRYDPPEPCLIVVESFALPDGEKGKRTQSWLGLWDEPLFAWAGLWRDVPGFGRGYLGVMAGANALIAPIAEHMPAILDREGQEAWLTAPLPQAAQHRRAFPEDAMYLERTDDPWPGSAVAG